MNTGMQLSVACVVIISCSLLAGHGMQPLLRARMLLHELLVVHACCTVSVASRPEACNCFLAAARVRGVGTTASRGGKSWRKGKVRQRNRRKVAKAESKAAALRKRAGAATSGRPLAAEATQSGAAPPLPAGRSCPPSCPPARPPQSQYLMRPSHEQVATFEVSSGCHSHPISTWSWHFMLRTICRDMDMGGGEGGWWVVVVCAGGGVGGWGGTVRNTGN